MQNLSHVSVLFDLDGTFIDTAKDLTLALNHAIAGQGMEPFEVDEAKYFVGKGVVYMLQTAFARANKTLDEAKQEHLTALLLEHYTANISKFSRPFPHAMTCLAALKKSGAQVGICTNKRFEGAELLLKQLGIFDQFDVVTGGDSFAFRKPDPRHLLETFARLKPAEKLFMIGDTINDFAAAKAANAVAVGVKFGYGLAADLAEADHLIDSFDELPILIAKLA